MRAQQVFTAYDRGPTRASRYRYCPSCGTTLVGDGSDCSRVRCSSCGWVHYRNPAPGVVIVIIDGDRVLLGKRGESSVAAHRWCLRRSGLPGHNPEGRWAACAPPLSRDRQRRSLPHIFRRRASTMNAGVLPWAGMRTLP